MLLFPGLGGYSPGVLRQAKTSHGEVDAVFDEIDAAAARLDVPSVSAALFDGEPRPIRELLAEPAEVLQLVIFGVSVAVHRILVARGVTPRLLVGHSFGEMAALVAAGAFTLADGVRLVCARAAALRPWEGRGGMAAIGVDEATAGHVAGVLDEPDLVVACLNAPRQTVLAGPLPALDRAERLAANLDLLFARLHLPYASHHPSMRPAVADFVARMGGIRQQPLELAVYSPVHGRRYTDDDDLKWALAECLVRPVRFTDAVRELHAKGCVTFIESGALNALTKCVEQTVPDVRAVAPLVDPDQEDAGLRAAADPTAPPPTRTSRNGQPSSTSAPARTSPPAEAQVVGVVGDPAPVAPEAPPAPAATDRRRVLAELRELYADALEYPADLLTEDALLEAELGVDSLKQTSLLGRVVERFGLTDRPAELPVWELPTLGRIADYVTTSGASR
ncbi:acyltransferase domain-containing protein [Saccharothrix sp. S26]|uniref:acyltransferase domain-containing protein n=1 Tax=Saccharothrix sp. S26 TaxID=2907215 RepID=UPI001F24CC93|nr:acyltransferase domain-containing protein [Saccharothrix sp. S26]MCE6998365.1 acyltransferase domain-containing protein [Saccharothrix sp. S26]